VKPFRERNPILVGVISVAVLAAAMLFALSLNRFTFLRGVYTIKADFADAAGLTPDNEVRVAGLKVGKVDAVKLAPAAHGYSDRVRVTMEIKSGIKLGDLSEAEIKLKTLLGAKFVDITPDGTAPYIAAGGLIPLRRTRIPFEIYQVTNESVATIGKIDAKELNDALHELGTLFDDPNGNLGRALDGLAKATEGIKDRDAQLETLVQSGAQILQLLDSRSVELGSILDSGSKVLTALSANSDELQQFVTGTDSLAKQVTTLLQQNRTNLDPALSDLHTALQVVAKDIGPLEQALKVLGPDAKSFGSAFTQGHWGDIWLQTVLDVPVPPLLPAGGFPAPASANAHAQTLRTILAEAAK
jgi:phospholipid/cholesterol/gamma-HCH transport system substrate-binding protein